MLCAFICRVSRLRRVSRTGRKAFTITELAIAIMILGIMAAYITLNANTSKHTAKREAERIMTQLYRLVETANRKHVSFKVLFDSTEQTEHVDVEWQTSPLSYTKLELSKGFSIQNLNYTDNSNGTASSVDNNSFSLDYDLSKNGFIPPGMTLQVKGADESMYYIIIYVPGTRIRISDTKP